MRLCFDCLMHERPRWFGRYMLGWYLLLLYGVAAFASLDGQRGHWAQATFFIILFPWIVWPFFAALRAGTPR